MFEVIFVAISPHHIYVINKSYWATVLQFQVKSSGSYTWDAMYDWVNDWYAAYMYARETEYATQIRPKHY